MEEGARVEVVVEMEKVQLLSDHTDHPGEGRTRHQQIACEGHLMPHQRSEVRVDVVQAQVADADAELRDEALTVALGGIETTLRPMCWVWYLLALHPWAEARLHAELDAVLGGRAPQIEELARLLYLRKVVDETMRLCLPLLRERTDEIILRLTRGSKHLLGEAVAGAIRVSSNSPEFFFNAQS